MNPFVEVIYDMIYFGLEKFGRYYSTYPGLVHDSKDPENLHRLRLIIPGIADTPMDEWAWPKGVFSGLTFGAHCIPPEGSTVWVSFRLGDPNHPIWEQGHFGADDVKNWKPKQKRYNNFWFETPQGNLIELDDEEGTIRITDAHGTVVQTSSNGVSVIPVKGQKIYLGSEDKADEGTAMGQTTERIATAHHKSLLGAISSLTDVGESLNSMMVKMAAASTPIGAAAILISDAKPIVDSTKNMINNNKTLNKSLNAVNKDLPKIPSTKVLLDR